MFDGKDRNILKTSLKTLERAHTNTHTHTHEFIWRKAGDDSYVVITNQLWM